MLLRAQTKRLLVEHRALRAQMIARTDALEMARVKVEITRALIKRETARETTEEQAA